MAGHAIWGVEAGFRRAGKCPVVLVTAVLATGISLLWWSGNALGGLYAGPWRLIASVFPHVGAMHLAFNLWWLFVFGTEVESVLGSLKTLGLFALLAAGSSAWQEALAGQGVGLSGVGYGLFGLLWVLSATDRRFRGLVDKQTVEAFVGWFVFCCVLTGIGVWRVGNVAHGAGAILGALAGATLSRGVQRRLAFGAGTVVFLAAGIAGFLNPVPLVWMGASREFTLESAARKAIEEGRNQEASELYGELIRIGPASVHHFFNRGIAFQRLGRYEEALANYREAVRLDPSNPAHRQAVENLEAWKKAAGK